MKSQTLNPASLTVSALRGIIAQLDASIIKLKKRPEPIDVVMIEVERDLKCVEVYVDVLEARAPDGIDRRWAGEQLDGGEVVLGHSTDEWGREVTLTLEEQDEAKHTWIKLQERKES